MLWLGVRSVCQLDYKVTNHKLREVFKLAGNVMKAEIKEDKNGKSRGMGIVQFEQPLEAVQAICILWCSMLSAHQPRIAVFVAASNSGFAAFQVVQAGVW